MASEITVIPRRATDRPAPNDEPRPNDPMLARGTAAPEWTLDELADSATWSRTIREESARVARFGHPVTVVMAELPRLDVVIDRFGRGVGDRIATEAAHLLASEGRESDRLAWLGDAQFGVLLLETGEISAGHYVERVRTATDGWLESTGLSIRLSLGWASPGEGGDVMAAAATAKQRMHDADRRSMPSPRPRGRSERRPHDPAVDHCAGVPEPGTWDRSRHRERTDLGHRPNRPAAAEKLADPRIGYGAHEVDQCCSRPSPSRPQPNGLAADARVASATTSERRSEPKRRGPAKALDRRTRVVDR